VMIVVCIGMIVAPWGFEGGPPPHRVDSGREAGGWLAQKKKGRPKTPLDG